MSAHIVVLMDFHQEEHDEMTGTLIVRWTVNPTTPPQALHGCSTCNTQKPFKHSGKMRVNANGKRIDAWLIYTCTTCDTTWNRPILERQNIRTIDPAMLEAFQANDIGWAEKLAFDVGHLRRQAAKVQEFSDVKIEKSVMSNTQPWSALHILLRLPLPTSLRLDRLLANELGISRQRLLSLVSARHMRVGPEPRRILRRPIKDETSIEINLRALNDGPKLALAAGLRRLRAE